MSAGGVEFYDRHYREMPPSMRAFRRAAGVVKAANIVAVAGDLEVERVVDVGCGSGAVVRELSKRGLGSRFWAIDVTEEAIRRLLEGEPIPGLAEARTFEGERIPYADDSFDLAVLSHVIEHLEDPVPLLIEAARVARRLVVEVPLELNLHTLIKVGLLRSRYRREIGHVQWFSRRRFLDLLRDRAGLRIVRERMVFVPDHLYRLRKGGAARGLGIRRALRRMSPGLYNLLLTDHCIALLERPAAEGSG